MSVAARYINRELAGVFLVTLAMLLLVAVGGRFIGYLQEAAMGKFTGSTVLTIMYLRLPEFVQMVAPFAAYVAVVLTLGRLHADQEMVVLQGAGASTGRILRWLSITLVPIAMLVAFFSWYLTPLSERVLTEFLAEQRAESEFETVSPGTFHIYDSGRRVTYSEAMSEDRRTLLDVFISQRLDDGRQVTVWAQRGRQYVDPQSGSHYLILTKGRRYEGTPGDAHFRIIEFDELRQRLEVSHRRADDRFDVQAQATLSLDDTVEATAEWHWRLAMPLFCLVGGLLALSVSRVKPRQGRFARVVPGMLVMLFYYLSLLINRNAIAQEQIPAMLGLWGVHLAFLLAALVGLSRLAKPVRF